MTVAELIDALKDCDQEAEVVLAADAEGNEFGRLEEVGGCPMFYQDGQIEQDGPGDPCVILWP